MRTSILLIAVLLLSLLIPPTITMAQVRPVNNYGALGLGQMLRRLQTTASVMMIGAHPDDEDSALLAYLARGENARTAYLSLTRGDGGQNIIGPELFEPLGIIRTEELLQARKLDGAEQYFTSAFDYGFSKTLDEAKQKWPENIVLCDVVRVIREFKPLVVISRFTGTPSDGHGQHQYAGYITPLAVQAAADPTKCGDLPWQVRKLYVEQGGGDPSQGSLRINTGKFDPLFGRSYFEIAMEGRSQHRSQGEGRLELRGPFNSSLRLANPSSAGPETTPFDGLNTTIGGASETFVKDPKELGPTVGNKFRMLQEKLAEAEREFQPLDTKPTLSRLIAAKKLLYAASLAYSDERLRLGSRKELDVGLMQVLAEKERQIDQAIVIAAGIQADALADRETVSAGEDVGFSVRTYFPPESGITVKDVRPFGTCLSIDTGGCVGIRFDKAEDAKNAAPAFRRETPNDVRYFTAHVGDVAFTQPYWLRGGRVENNFRITDIHPWDFGAPFEQPPIMVELKVDVGGTEIRVQRPVEYRYADPARGEVRRELNIVPAITLNADRDLLIFPFGNTSQTRRLSVTVTNNSNRTAAGKVSVWDPQFSPTFDPKPFDLKRKDQAASFNFDISVPAKTSPGRYHFSPRFVKENTSADYSMHIISYPHIQTHRYYTFPGVDVRVIDLNTVPLNVGYIMGSGDEVPDAIRQMGLNVTMIDDVAATDLSKFDAVVVGIRASEVRADLISNNQKILDYVRNGGNVIVQYQRGNWTSIAPYPANTQDRQGTAAGSINRVVDENAPVKILDAQHPVFNFPNKITDDDFKNWVQERNAYNLVTFDPQYTPLLESHDAGEQENKGGLVVARVGKGTWVYCSYSFFRQLPAGVPGAYRLFANILSIGRTPAAK